MSTRLIFYFFYWRLCFLLWAFIKRYFVSPYFSYSLTDYKPTTSGSYHIASATKGSSDGFGYEGRYLLPVDSAIIFFIIYLPNRKSISGKPKELRHGSLLVTRTSISGLSICPAGKCR